MKKVINKKPILIYLFLVLCLFGLAIYYLFNDNFITTSEIIKVTPTEDNTQAIKQKPRK